MVSTIPIDDSARKNQIAARCSDGGMRQSVARSHASSTAAVSRSNDNASVKYRIVQYPDVAKDSLVARINQTILTA